MNVMCRKKSLSPLIATILLIVIIVILVTILLNWGTTFTQDSLDYSDKITHDASYDNIGYYAHFNNSKNKNGSLYIKYDPPINTQDIDVNIVGFRLLDDPLPSVTYLEEEIELDLGINYVPLDINEEDVAGNTFDIEIHFDNGYVLKKFDLRMYYNKIYGSDSESESESGSCPEGYVLVPNDPTYDTGNFCVMQFEAKIDMNGDGLGNVPEGDYAHCGCDASNTWRRGCVDYGEEEPGAGFGYDPSCWTGELVSTSQGAPISSLNQQDAINLCGSIGENYHLITNDEWMTIARNIEDQSENWTGGSVGSGTLKRGHVGCNLGEYLDSRCDGCYGDWDDNFDYGLIEDRNELAKLVLSNGNEIWDLSGNLEEYINISITRADLPQNIIYEVDLGNSFTFEEGGNTFTVDEILGPDPESGAYMAIIKEYNGVNLINTHYAFEGSEISGSSTNVLVSIINSSNVSIAPAYYAGSPFIIEWFDEEISDYGSEGRSAYAPSSFDYNIDHGMGFMYSYFENSASEIESIFVRGGTRYDEDTAGIYAVNTGFDSESSGSYQAGFRCVTTPN